MTETASSFAYIETSIAPGVTISSYRRTRPPCRRRRLSVRRVRTLRSGG
jgi:hypothetical protein